jgi:secernin
MSAMCDVLCALPAATSGVTLFAKNSDRPPAERQVLEWLAPRLDTSPVRATHVAVAPLGGRTLGVLGSRPVWGWGLEHGVNVAGVAAGNATIYTRSDPRTAPDALTGMDLVRLALERGATADEAVAVIQQLLRTVGQGGSGHDGKRRPYWSSFLVADPAAAFVVETSGNECAVEPVDRVRAISNRTTIPSFDAAHRHPAQPVERLVDPRWQASQHVLDHEPVTVERLQAHLASHVGGEGGWTVCMHVDDPEHGQTTNASLVAELPPQGPPIAHVTTGRPCTSRWHRIPVAPPTDGDQSSNAG